MSWTSNGFFRNVNILKRLDATATNQLIDLYQPGTLNTQSLKPDVRYSGFITSLRIAVDISSVSPVEFPAREPGMSDGELNTLLRQLDAGAPKKMMDLFLRSSDSEPLRIGSISLYNRRPYYNIDILYYLTDAAACDIASDAVLSVQVRGVGYGLLTGTDSVSIFGSSVEEAENTAPSLIVNVFGGGGSGGSTATGNVVTDEAGQVITNNAGELVTSA
ncbi:hypothetical protein IQ268_11140 [Oculatella sp. LEGE 06141]|uniref:hypothetical protein n=1 Tax=Oculatella sp. LEGE 06141 TaxID=1828648 RepID=UPI00187EB86E|nr:hypothetical protein [Oculatella sp. LEGE 06141]MBE9179116.1 hypothetical protein [Oculatella sp. LEGE 06141]